MMKRLVSLVVVGLLVAACGGDDEEEKPAGQPGTTNKQSAVAATQTTIAAVSGVLSTSGGADRGTNSANQLGAAANQTQGIISPAAGNTTGQAFAALADFLRPQANPAGYTGTCECTETGCTFTACKGPNIQIDGSYSWGGGKLKCSGLKFDYSGGAAGTALAKVTTNLDCDMTITTTSMDGTFHTTGSSRVDTGGQGTFGSSWDTTLTFKAVTFAASGGAPTGGSESVKGTYTVEAGGQTQTYNGSTDITFPAN